MTAVASPAAAPSRSVTAGRILDAATTEFAERGFHGTSIKDLGEAAGVRSATLYYHFANKEEILVEIMRATLVDLTATVEDAVAGLADPVVRLGAAVGSHIRFHVAHPREVFLCDAELRALSRDHRAEVVSLRDRYEGIFREIVRAGRDAGVLTVPDTDLVVRSLLTSCSAVAFWYRPDGTLSVDEVADGYEQLFLRALRAT